MRLVRQLCLSLAVASMTAAAAHAGTAEKTVAFKIGEWIDLASTDGPVTLHRIRLVREGGITKSTFMRPGNSQYLADVQIQLEFTNDATRDWEANFVVEWVDADGKAIDGYKGDEGLDSEKRHDQQTVTLSTLKYGIDTGEEAEDQNRLQPRLSPRPDAVIPAESRRRR